MHPATCCKSCGGTGGSETSKIARVFSDFGVGFVRVGAKYGIEGVFDWYLPYGDFVVVEVGTGFICMIEFVKHWEVDDTGDHFAIFSAGNLGTPNRQAIGKIDGAIDGVDNEAVVRSGFIRVEFFADNSEVWIVLLDFTD